MQRHAVSIFRPLRMGGSRRRPQPILGPNTAARKAIPLLRPLPAGVAVYHASNYAIVSEHVQKKVKKSAGKRDSPQPPTSRWRRNVATGWICRMQAGQNRKGTLPADHADARRWGREAWRGGKGKATNGRRGSSGPTVPLSVNFLLS